MGPITQKMFFSVQMIQETCLSRMLTITYILLHPKHVWKFLKKMLLLPQ